MPCKSCRSIHQHAYPSEINIHPPHDSRNLDKPTVWAFPLLLVCIECGAGEFVLTEAELQELRHSQVQYWGPDNGFNA
jgi:hypothetical protein